MNGVYTNTSIVQTPLNHTSPVSTSSTGVQGVVNGVSTNTIIVNALPNYTSPVSTSYTRIQGKFNEHSSSSIVVLNLPTSTSPTSTRSAVMGKARVTPKNSVSIPRLELAAATVSVKIADILKEELEYDRIEDHYWTDSKVVLGFINNESRRFHTYVANPVQVIQDTDPSQWHYIETANLIQRTKVREECQRKPSWRNRNGSRDLTS